MMILGSGLLFGPRCIPSIPTTRRPLHLWTEWRHCNPRVFCTIDYGIFPYVSNSI